MSVPTPLDNDKETHGFLPGLWACFSRKYHWRTGGQKSPDNVMSLLIDEQLEV